MLLGPLPRERRSDRGVVALGLVEDLAAYDAPRDLREQQLLLLLDLLKYAAVLRGPPGQVRQHLLHRAVWYVFVGRVAGLTCGTFGRDALS